MTARSEVYGKKIVFTLMQTILGDGSFPKFSKLRYTSNYMNIVPLFSWLTPIDLCLYARFLSMLHFYDFIFY